MHTDLNAPTGNIGCRDTKTNSGSVYSIFGPRVPDYVAVYYGIEKDNIKKEVWCLKKNLNASRLSEHPTQGGKCQTLSRWDIIGCKDETSSWH